MNSKINTTLRFLNKYKGFTAINIIGLSIGMAVCFMIFNYLIHELGFDNFNTKKDQIYRIALKAQTGGREITAPFSVGTLGQEAVQEIPGVEDYVRFYSFGNFEVEKDERKYSDLEGIYIDSSFFKIFDYRLVSGIPQTALMVPKSVVITESLAERLFADEDPYMNTLRLDDEDFTITGIMEDFPSNSHLSFDLAVSFSTICNSEFDITKNEGVSFPTYLVLNENSNPDTIASQLSALNDRIIDDLFGAYSLKTDLWLQPLNDVHLKSNFTFEYANISSISNIYLFSALAIFIIIIAVINFINLSTAIYEKRAREIGIRKIVGAQRNNLIGQFISESVILAFISFLISLLWVELLTTPFSELMNVIIPVVYWQSPLYFFGIIVFVIVVGVISGSYPAFYLSGIKVFTAIKGGIIPGRNKYALRKVLVVLQFGISAFMIIIIALLFLQMRFVKNKELGFERENIIVFQNFTEKIIDKYETLKPALSQIPEITSLAASQQIPGKNRTSNNMVYKEGDSPDNSIIMNVNRVMPDYITTMGIELKEGRVFSKENGLDSVEFILNETAAVKLGLDDPVGKKIYEMDSKGPVVGIVKDYHVKSLHRKIEPVVLKISSRYFRYISVKILSGNPKPVLEKIKGVFQEFDPAYETDYIFIDNVFHELYDAEDRTFSLFSYAAILAIVISLLGLFSLTSISMQKRNKEIGVRKTLGAGVGQIVILLLNSITRWTLIANLIAWPVAYVFMKNWLLKFEYRINIIYAWYAFVLAALIVYGISILTVYFLSRKAALSNPVDALRYE